MAKNNKQVRKRRLGFQAGKENILPRALSSEAGDGHLHSVEMFQGVLETVTRLETRQTPSRTPKLRRGGENAGNLPSLICRALKLRLSAFPVSADECSKF